MWKAYKRKYMIKYKWDGVLFMNGVYKRSYKEIDYNKVKGLNMVYEYKGHEYIIYRPCNGFTVESEKKQHEYEQYKIDQKIENSNKPKENSNNAKDDLKCFFDLIDNKEV